MNGNKRKSYYDHYGYEEGQVTAYARSNEPPRGPGGQQEVTPGFGRNCPFRPSLPILPFPLKIFPKGCLGQFWRSSETIF